MRRMKYVVGIKKSKTHDMIGLMYCMILGIIYSYKEPIKCLFMCYTKSEIKKYINIFIKINSSLFISYGGISKYNGELKTTIDKNNYYIGKSEIHFKLCGLTIEEEKGYNFMIGCNESIKYPQYDSIWIDPLKPQLPRQFIREVKNRKAREKYKLLPLKKKKKGAKN